MYGAASPPRRRPSGLALLPEPRASPRPLLAPLPPRRGLAPAEAGLGKRASSLDGIGAARGGLNGGDGMPTEGPQEHHSGPEIYFGLAEEVFFFWAKVEGVREGKSQALVPVAPVEEYWRPLRLPEASTRKHLASMVTGAWVELDKVAITTSEGALWSCFFFI